MNLNNIPEYFGIMKMYQLKQVKEKLKL